MSGLHLQRLRSSCFVIPVGRGSFGKAVCLTHLKSALVQTR